MMTWRQFPPGRPPLRGGSVVRAEESCWSAALSVTAPRDTAPTRIRTGGAPRVLALDGTALFVAEQAGCIVRIPFLPDLGEPEEIAVGLPRIDAIALSPDRINLIADGRLIAYLPKL